MDNISENIQAEKASIQPSKIFLYWFLTTVCGGTLLSVIIPVCKGIDISFVELYLIYIGIAWALSTVFYLPTLIAMLVSIQNNEKRTLKEQYKALVKAHWLSFLITFLACNAWILLKPRFLYAVGYFALEALIFAIVAMVIWRIGFRKIRRQITNDR